MEFFATCPAGFEHLLADELRAMHTPHVRPLKGQVAFDGVLADAYRVCLWSHLASRVACVLARGNARDADELYACVADVAWEDELAPGERFAIDAQGTNQQLRNTQFVALRAKDAIVDRLLSRTGRRAESDPRLPGLRVLVRVTRERASVAIDLAGNPLFRRGYESTRGGRGRVAPLRPDYAAALLAQGGWRELCHGDSIPTLVVPFTGMGSIAVEGTLMALDRAPGLLQPRWAAAHWAHHDEAAWEALVDEAHARAKAGEERPLSLQLSDLRSGSEAAVRQALHAAGIHRSVSLSPADRLSCGDGARALVAADLSWVDNESVADQASALEQVIAASQAMPAGTAASVLAHDRILDGLFGTPTAEASVMLGRDEASLVTYALPDETVGHPVSLAGGQVAHALVSGSDQFAARLAKVYRQRRKWAQREDVSCYRIYDADLPDYAVSIDLFEGSETPGRWLQIYEYAPPRSVDATLARQRLLDVVAIAPRLLDVLPKATFVRVRTKAKGGSQYADEARHPSATRPGREHAGKPALPTGARLIDEGGLTFEVNFQSRLDCGIFLDHRDTRAMLREMAKETLGSKRFLNLFAYTGTATCYAADGGARHTTTVDLSRPSLEWAQRNMERNGFTGPEHEYVQADVIAWVSEQRHTKNRWDLVFCDVPTFSNSSRMRKASFDVQRDHAELLIGVSRLLTANGVCVFSCNLRTFKIDEAALAKAGVTVEDITAETIPEDFARNPRIHKCYLVRRTPRQG